MPGYTEQLWQWLYPPLRDLREKCRAEPTVGWSERLAQFLGALRISSVDDHPVVRALADRVGEQSQPISYVADDAFEGVVYGLIEDYAAKQAALSQPTLLTRPASGTEPAPVQQSPETAAERAVTEIGLPALRDTLTERPDLHPARIWPRRWSPCSRAG